MQTITYTEVRKTLADTLTQVCEDHQPTIITRRQQPAVVLLSLEDYNALLDTAYLLRSPNNAKRLFSAIEELNTGKGEAHQLVESFNDDDNDNMNAVAISS